MVTTDKFNHCCMGKIVLGEETIKTVLKNAGLTEKEALVYISLAKHEPLEGTEIAKLTKKDKAQVFRIIKNLQAKGFVESTIDYPARYTVTPFENILETVVKFKREEITSIEKAKGELIHYLKKKNQIEPSLEKFVIIKGNRKIYSRIYKIFKETKHQLSVAMTFQSFVTADRLGVFDFTLKVPRRTQSKYRFLTEVTKENLNFIKELSDRMPKPMFSFKATNPNLGFTLFPRMIMRDKEEILFFTSTSDAEKRKDEVVLWTNSKSLVQAFETVFEDLWRNSTDLQDRVSEIKIGKPPPKTCFLSNPEEAKKKYEETLHCAEIEIVFMTSSKSLNEYLYRERLEEWFKKGISVRIMTPVTSKNLETIRKISKFCRIKHVPIGYPETTIVDNEHYFQFKTTPREKTNSALDFENAFYTNDFEYAHKMKKLFEDLWKNAYSPSPVTLETILEGTHTPQDQPSSDRKTLYLKPISGLGIKDWKLRSNLAERDVLKKLIGSRKLVPENLPKNVTRMHGSMGSAIVHPPDSFKLPDMLFTVFHVEKHSSFGEEDSMLISIQRETTKGPMYVPSAYVGDNPQAQTIWKAFMSGTPAGQNVQLFKKNEIQIQIHGTTLFVAWTKQIPLFPPQYILPPSCLLMEGYGDLKTDSYSMVSPSGYKIDVERNGFEAFVTFFHPESKYSGPGTDGFFARDYVSTVYEPSVSEETKQGVS
jgi:sugar-specific transcriptional regulator TrmB